MITEELGRDPNGDPSSQPIIKTGPNRGWRKKEVAGTWKYMGGYCSERGYPGSSGSQHVTWVSGVQELGFRVGRLCYEGVVSFYAFVGSDK